MSRVRLYGRADRFDKSNISVVSGNSRLSVCVMKIKCFSEPVNAQKTISTNLVLVTVNKTNRSSYRLQYWFSVRSHETKSLNTALYLISAIARAHWNDVYFTCMTGEHMIHMLNAGDGRKNYKK